MSQDEEARRLACDVEQIVPFLPGNPSDGHGYKDHLRALVGHVLRLLDEKTKPAGPPEFVHPSHLPTILDDLETTNRRLLDEKAELAKLLDTAKDGLLEYADLNEKCEGCDGCFKCDMRHLVVKIEDALDPKEVKA